MTTTTTTTTTTTATAKVIDRGADRWLVAFDTPARHTVSVIAGNRWDAVQFARDDIARRDAEFARTVAAVRIEFVEFTR